MLHTIKHSRRGSSNLLKRATMISIIMYLAIQNALTLNDFAGPNCWTTVTDGTTTNTTCTYRGEPK